MPVLAREYGVHPCDYWKWTWDELVDLTRDFNDRVKAQRLGR